MPEFEYTALNASGKHCRGSIGAYSATEARGKLREKGLNVLSMRSGEKQAEAAEAPERTGRVKKREIATAFRQLSTLLRGGMALVPALEALSEQLSGTPLGRVMTRMQERVRTGAGFGDAMDEYPAVFPEIFVSMVNAGEAVGALDEVLGRLAEMTERSLEVSGKVKAAMAYPAVLLFVGTAVIIFLLTFVVPGMIRLFDDLGQGRLPLPTVMLMGISSFLSAYFWHITIGIALAAAGVRMALRYDAVRVRMDWLKLRVPVVGRLLMKASLARFTRTLGVMLGSGVPVLQALENAGRVTANSALTAKLKEASKQVEEGAGLAGPFDQSGIFPPIVVHMVAAGEAGGNVEEGLMNVSDIYQTEIENSIRTLTSLVEPVMILVMGAIIGFMVLAVLLPIFEINQLIG